MIDRRAFIVGAVAALAAPLAAEAQPAGKVYRIGLLEGPFPPIWDTRSLLTVALASLGYVEGRNAIIEAGSRAPIKTWPQLPLSSPALESI